MEKANMHSLDMVNENIKKIGNLFPECVTETVDENGKIEKIANFKKSEEDEQKEKQVILLKLEESPEIQLQYIEIGLQKLNANLQENENNIEEDEPGQIASLLRLHIKLLCQLGYTKKILPNLKKNPLYPLDECLKLCLEYNVSDAAIYLYQATGDSAKALEMSLRIFEDKFIKISNNLRKEKEFSENIHTLLLQEMQNDLLGCINVCEHNEQQNDKSAERDSNKYYRQRLYGS